MKNLLITFLSFLLFTGLQAQSEREHVRTGNEQYHEEQFAEAEASYLKALEKDPSMKEGLFNLGDALYKGERYESAAQQFQHSGLTLSEPLKKAGAYHNLGNSLLKSEKLEESIEAYKQALRHNPYDLDTKYNLSYAQRMLKKQQQEQDQEDKNENEKEEEENKDQKQEQQEQEDKDKKKEEQENKNENSDDDKDETKRKPEEPPPERDKKNEKQPQENKKQPQPEPRGLSKEEAARLLNALLNEEKKLQEKLQKQKIKPSHSRVEKDW